MSELSEALRTCLPTGARTHPLTRTHTNAQSAAHYKTSFFSPSAFCLFVVLVAGVVVVVVVVVVVEVVVVVVVLSLSCVVSCV